MADTDALVEAAAKALGLIGKLKPVGPSAIQIKAWDQTIAPSKSAGRAVTVGRLGGGFFSCPDYYAM